MKLTEAKKTEYKSVVVYGPPKSGKSVLVSKLSEHFKLLWIDLENGWEILTKLPPEWQERIELIALQDTRTYPIGIETCMKIFQGTRVKVCHEHGKVGCAVCLKANAPSTEIELNELGPEWIVVLDSATQLTDSGIAHIVKDKDVEYKLQTDDWGSLGKYLAFVFSHIQAAKWNTVVITHEIDISDEKEPERLVPQAGTKNFARNFAKYFGHVVRLEVKNKAHKASSSTTYSTNALTGSRSDVALEKGEMNLLRIFKPELFPEAEQIPAENKNATPGVQAVSRLQALKAQMTSKG